MLCQNCNKHKATVTWLGSGGVLDYVHGAYQQWCDCCSIKAQLKYAREKAKSIPKLEKQLEHIKCSQPDTV